MQKTISKVQNFSWEEWRNQKNRLIPVNLEGKKQGKENDRRAERIWAGSSHPPSRI